MCIIETERSTLREFAATDSAFVFELLNTKGWLDFVGDRNIRNVTDAKNYIEDRISLSYVNHGFGFYLVELKESGIPIGMCGLVKREELKNVDLGFAFLPAYEHKGYAYESSLACLSFAKEKLAIKELSAITIPTNVSSIHLLKKLNFEFDKIIQMQNDPEELMLFNLTL